jgi:hypothetical protein
MKTYFIIIIIIIFIICCCSSLIGAYLYTQSTSSKVQSISNNTQSTQDNTQSRPTKVQSTPSITQDIKKCTKILKPNTCTMTKDGVYIVCSGIPEGIQKKKITDIGDKGTYSMKVKLYVEKNMKKL